MNSNCHERRTSSIVLFFTGIIMAVGGALFVYLWRKAMEQPENIENKCRSSINRIKKELSHVSQ
jgi:hypothetical protein